MHITLFSFVTAVLLSSCNGSAVEQLADRSTLLEPKVSQDDSDAEFWLSGLSLSVLFGTDIFLCGVAVCRCDPCAVTDEPTT